MTEEKITIVIDDQGEMLVKTKRILGPACVEEVEKLLEEMALITEINRTDEYHMRENVSEAVKTKQVVKH